MSTAKAERIRELSAANTQESRDELMKWFKSLPQAEPASDARQAERTVVVKALAGMMPLPEFKAFGLGVLNTEINALREAKKLEQENYYPRDLIFATFESLVRGSPEQDIVDTLSTYAQDRNVASDVRARFKAFLTERQFQQDGPRDLDGYTGVKRDYLIFLATDTLFKHLSRSGTLSDSERECLKPLRRLIDTMPDSGAFSWRHRAAGNLNTIYEKLGVDEKVRYVTDPSVDEPSERNNVR